MVEQLGLPRLHLGSEAATANQWDSDCHPNCDGFCTLKRNRFYAHGEWCYGTIWWARWTERERVCLFHPFCAADVNWFFSWVLGCCLFWLLLLCCCRLVVVFFVLLLLSQIGHRVSVMVLPSSLLTVNLLGSLPYALSVRFTIGNGLPVSFEIRRSQRFKKKQYFFFRHRICFRFVIKIPSLCL